MTDDAEALRHKRKMAHRKAVQNAEVASKATEKGLRIVMTRPGKGKSIAAFASRSACSATAAASASGRLVAAAATEVLLVAAGLPLRVT